MRDLPKSASLTRVDMHNKMRFSQQRLTYMSLLSRYSTLHIGHYPQNETLMHPHLLNR